MMASSVKAIAPVIYLLIIVIIFFSFKEVVLGNLCAVCMDEAYFTKIDLNKGFCKIYHMLLDQRNNEILTSSRFFSKGSLSFCSLSYCFFCCFV